VKEMERQQFLLRDGRKLVVFPQRLQEIVSLSSEGRELMDRA